MWNTRDKATSDNREPFLTLGNGTNLSTIYIIYSIKFHNNLKKTAAEIQKMLFSAYGEEAIGKALHRLEGNIRSKFNPSPIGPRQAELPTRSTREKYWYEVMKEDMNIGKETVRTIVREDLLSFLKTTQADSRTKRK